MGRGRPERLLVPGAHAERQGAPSPRLGRGGLACQGTSHRVGNKAQRLEGPACTRDSQPGLDILAGRDVPAKVSVCSVGKGAFSCSQGCFSEVPQKSWARTKTDSEVDEEVPRNKVLAVK